MAEGAGETLSERELEIVRLMATGVTNREIAARLVISPNTVKVHLRNIFAKLGVESRTEATLAAIRNGWVDLPATPATDVAIPAPAQAPVTWTRRAFLTLAVGGSALLALAPRHADRTLEPSNALSDHEVGPGAPASPDMAQRWSARAPLPAASERFACASFQGRIFVIGGETAEGVSGEVEAYDPAGDRWESRSPKPTAVANVGAAVLGEEVYVPGGYDGQGRVSSGVEVYSPAKDSWRAAHPMPSPRCAYAAAEAGGRLYLFGGWDGTRYVADVLIYDPRQDAWSHGSPLGEARGFAAAAALGGRIYVAGGYDGNRELASCEVYDPALERSGQSPWKGVAAMLAARGGLGLVAAGNRLYAIGGGWNGGLTFNESYDPRDNRWLTLSTPVLEQWRTLGVAGVESSLGTTLFALGGWSGDRMATNQAYRALLNVYLPALP